MRGAGGGRAGGAGAGRRRVVRHPAGVRGVLVRDEGARERVYLVCEPASHYYRVMTRSDWMPVLIGERI